MSKKSLTNITLTQILKPWYNITPLFGIMPYKLSKDEFGKEQIKLSWKILFTIIWCIHHVWAFVKYFPNLSKKKEMSRFVSLGNYTIYPVMGFAFVTTHIIQAKKSFSILEKLTKIDIQFRSMNIASSFKNQQKNLMIGFFIGFTIYGVLYGIAYPVLFELQSAPIPFSIRFIYFWIEISTFLYLLKAWIVLKVIEKNFEAINKKLLSYIEKNFGNKNLDSSVLPHLFEKTFVEEENGCHEEIRQLRELHESLIDICEIFNEVEEIPIICTLTYVVYLIITNFFFTFNAWYNHAANVAASVVSTSLIILSIFCLGLFLIPTLARTSKEVKNKAGCIKIFLNSLHIFMILFQQANRTGAVVLKVLGKINGNYMNTKREVIN